MIYASQPKASWRWRFPAKRIRAHIFLSFKTEERKHAAQLKDALTQKGFKVWWQEEIQCGQEWHGEIDRAVAQAGCIVVLWSARAMASPWVRHEASQAVARNMYAPARIELVEIENPYARLQATDLINWDGDLAHPGFNNLLKRINELLPPPTPWWRWLLQQGWARKGALLIAVIALFSMWLLVKQTTIIARAKQVPLRLPMQKTLSSIKGKKSPCRNPADRGEYSVLALACVALMADEMRMGGRG